MFELLAVLVLVNAVMAVVMAVQAARYRRATLVAPRDDVSLTVLVPTEGDDPTLPAVLAAIEAQPWRADRQVLVCDPRLAGEPPPGTNRKSHFLAAGVARADHNVIVVVDSRVVLGAGALAALVGQLETQGAKLRDLEAPPPGRPPDVVAAFASSVGLPEQPLLAAISRHLARGHAHGWPVLAGLAWTTGDVPPASGSCFAARRDALLAVGGFEALRDTIAEDLLLARRLDRIGDVRLAPVEAEVRLGAIPPGEWLERWVRWIRVGVSVSPARGLGYPLLLAPLPLALLFAGPLLVGPEAPWAVGLLAALVVVRALPALALGDRDAWAGPLADLVIFTAAAKAAASRRVTWRGRRFVLGEEGRLLETAPSGLPPLAFALLALFAAIGLGFRLDGVVYPGADGLFVLACGVVAGASIRPLWLIPVVALLGFGSEVCGVATGIPFGQYRYLDALGPKLFEVPLALAPTWLATAGGAIGLARGRWVEATVLLVATDLVLDPLAAGVLGYWSWFHHGFIGLDDPGWYGVPWVNFVGWTVVGAPLCWLLRGHTSRTLTAIGWLNLVFFGALALWQRLEGPVIVALLAAGWVLGGRALLAAPSVVAGKLTRGPGRGPRGV